MLYTENPLLMEKAKRFGQVHGDRLWGGDFYLDKYRICSLDVSRRTNADCRRYLFGDLLGKGGLDGDKTSRLVAHGKLVHPNERDASFMGGGSRFASRSPKYQEL